MKVNDYSSQLSDQRESHQNSVAKLKDSYESQIKNINETNELLTEETRENNALKRKSLIRENQERIDVSNEKTQKLLEERRDNYKNSLLTEKDDFRRDRLKLTEGFQNKLTDIKGSYDDAIRQHKYVSKSQLENTRENLNRKMDIKDRNSNHQIEDIQQKSKDTIEKQRRDMTHQKKDLVKSHIQESDAKSKEHVSYLKKIKDHNDDQLERVVTNRDIELNNSNERFDTAMKRSRSDDRRQIARLTDRYEESGKRVRDISKRDYKKLQEKFVRERYLLNQDKQEEIYAVNKEKEDITDRTFRGEGVEFQKQELRDSYENRLDGMKDHMVEQRLKFEHDLKGIRNISKSEDYDRKVENKEDRDDLRKDFNSKLYENINRSNNKQGEVERSSNISMRAKEEEHNLKTNNDRIFYKKIIDNQRKHFGNNMSQVEQKNIDKIENMQQEYRLEKNEISKLSRGQVEETIRMQRENFNNKVEKLVSGYEHKLKKANEELARVKEISTNQLSNQTRSSQHKLRAENEFYTETTNLNNQDFKNRENELRAEYQRQTNRLRDRFNDQIAKIKRDNDVHMTKVVQMNNENREKMILEHQTELRLKLNASNTKLEGVMKDANYQRERLVEGYERRLKDLKQAYELEQVATYKA